MSLKTRAKQLKRDTPALFLALRDKDTPVLAKVFAGLAVAYAMSPVDIIPDFIPVLGTLDDLIILPLLAAAAIKLIPPEKLEECRKKAEGLWEDGKPKKWYYALPIVFFWLLVLWLIIKLILKTIAAE